MLDYKNRPVYAYRMHELQQKLLKLAESKNLGQFTLREVGAFVGETSPQKIKHHMQQLERRGLLRIDRHKGLIEKMSKTQAEGFLMKGKLLQIPIVGAANAGPAEIFAATNIEGYLRVSPSLLTYRPKHRLFAVKVQGPSMNQAVVNGKLIEDGDYVIVDSEDREAHDNDVVLSVIDGLANIKRFYVDKENNQILLMSDSTHDFPAIHIHADDDFMVNGKIIGVVKTPKKKKRG